MGKPDGKADCFSDRLPENYINSRRQQNDKTSYMETGTRRCNGSNAGFCRYYGDDRMQCGEYGKRRRRSGAQFRIGKRQFRRKFRKRRYGAVS